MTPASEPAREESMKLLTKGEFIATFTNPMNRLPAEAEPPFDFWPYFDGIPAEDFGGFDCSEGRVQEVYQTSGGRYQHVLVNSDDANVFMVLVLTVPEQVVYGHRLLNLNEEYGLPPGGP